MYRVLLYCFTNVVLPVQLNLFVPFFFFEQSSTKTSCQCFRETCLCGEDFYIYVAFRRAREIRAPKNLNCCKFQLRVKLEVQSWMSFLWRLHYGNLLLFSSEKWNEWTYGGCFCTRANFDDLQLISLWPYCRFHQLSATLHIFSPTIFDRFYIENHYYCPLNSSYGRFL